MKMTKLFGLLAIGALVLMLAPSANAVCTPAKLYSTWDFTDLAYYYVYWGPNSSEDSSAFISTFWEPGARSLASEGTCDDSAWVKYYPGYGWYISGSWGDACTTGCAAGGMILQISDDKGGFGADFAVGTTAETPNKANHYNFGAFNLTPIPRPKVTASSQSGTDSILDLQWDSISAGFSTRGGLAETSAITAIKLYTYLGTDPGRAIGSWTLHSTYAYTGGVTSAAGVVIDCSAGTQTQIASSIEFNGGQYETPLVGLPTTISCGDPTMADPDDKFDIIKTRGKGLKKGRPFQD